MVSHSQSVVPFGGHEWKCAPQSADRCNPRWNSPSHSWVWTSKKFSKVKRGSGNHKKLFRNHIDKTRSSHVHQTQETCYQIRELLELMEIVNDQQKTTGSMGSVLVQSNRSAIEDQSILHYAHGTSGQSPRLVLQANNTPLLTPIFPNLSWSP